MVFSLFIIRVSFPSDFEGGSDGGGWEKMKTEGVMWVVDVEGRRKKMNFIIIFNCFI
jgi:hypothetical protein